MQTTKNQVPMKTTEFSTIDSESLKRYMDAHRENDYILVDVRQPVEYETHHIPGSLPKPLNQLMQSFDGLPEDKDIIFYCHVGARSRVAAMAAAEEAFFEGKLYSLDGGIQAWSGKTLAPVPRVGVFNRSQTLTGFLETAMNMEKGAERFYRTAYEKFAGNSFASLFDQLAGVETAHAKLLYTIYLKNAPSDTPPFDVFYGNLAGDIIEGGESLDRCVEQLTKMSENACLSLMEFALDIEFAAYDLYRTMANQNSDDSEISAAFLSIAEAEKSHMRIISAGFETC